MASSNGNPPGGPNVKVVRRTLADGSVKEYRYTKGERTPRQRPGILRELFDKYVESPNFKKIGPQWQEKKKGWLTLIEDRLGWMTMADLTDVRARAEFYELRDSLASHPASADQMVKALASVLAWAYDQGRISVNHAARMSRLVDDPTPRTDCIYDAEMHAALVAGLPDDLRRVYLVALYTGLRRGDLISMTWSDLTPDGVLIVKPGKTVTTTGVTVHLPTRLLPPLAEALAELPRVGRTILTTRTGKPWTRTHVTMTWLGAMRKLGIENRHLHDIRHTTATALVEAGCTEAERGAVMGHALADGAGKSYVARTRALAESAYRKWSKALGESTVIYPDVFSRKTAGKTG
jgi:integrase